MLRAAVARAAHAAQSSARALHALARAVVPDAAHRQTSTRASAHAHVAPSPRPDALPHADVRASFCVALRAVAYATLDPLLAPTPGATAWTLLSPAAVRSSASSASSSTLLTAAQTAAVVRGVHVYAQHVRQTPLLAALLGPVAALLQRALASAAGPVAPRELWARVTAAAAASHGCDDNNDDASAAAAAAAVHGAACRVLAALLLSPALTERAAKLHAAYGVAPALAVRAFRAALTAACPQAVLHETRAVLRAAAAAESAGTEAELSAAERAALEKGAAALAQGAGARAVCDTALAVHVVGTRRATRALHNACCVVRVACVAAPTRRPCTLCARTAEARGPTPRPLWNETVPFLLCTGPADAAGAAGTAAGDTVTVTVALCERAPHSRRRRVVARGRVVLDRRRPPRTHGTEQWLRRVVPLAPPQKSDRNVGCGGGDGDEEEEGDSWDAVAAAVAAADAGEKREKEEAVEAAAVCAGVLVEVSLQRFAAVPARAEQQYRVLVRRLCASERAERVRQTRLGADTVPPDAAYPLCTALAQSLARECATRLGIAPRAALVRLEELVRALDRDPLAAPLLRAAERTLAALARTAPPLPRACAARRAAALAALRAQTTRWLDRFFVVFASPPALDAALALFSAVLRAQHAVAVADATGDGDTTAATATSDDDELPRLLEGCCARAAAYSLELECADCGSAPVPMPVADLADLAARLCDALAQHAGAFAAPFARHGVDVGRVFARTYAAFVRGPMSAAIAAALRGTDDVAGALRLYRALGPLAHATAPLPVCAWFAPFFAHAVWDCCRARFDDIRAKTLAQDTAQPPAASSSSSSSSSSVVDLFAAFAVVGDAVGSTLRTPTCEPRATVDAFVRTVWREYAVAVRSVVCAYGQDISVLCARDELGADNDTRAVLDLHGVLLRNLEAAHEYLALCEETVARELRAAGIDRDEAVAGEFQKTHHALCCVTDEMCDRLARSTQRRLLALLSADLFGADARSSLERKKTLLGLAKPKSQQQQEQQQQRRGGKKKDEEDDRDALFDMLNAFLTPFGERLAGGCAFAQLLAALWDRVVQCLELCAVQHAAVLAASCEQRAAFHDYVHTLKVFFYADGRGIRPVDAAAGAAAADECAEMLALDRAALAAIAADTTPATSAAQRSAAAFLLEHTASVPTAPEAEKPRKRRFSIKRHAG